MAKKKVSTGVAASNVTFPAEDTAKTKAPEKKKAVQKKVLPKEVSEQKVPQKEVTQEVKKEVPTEIVKVQEDPVRFPEKLPHEPQPSKDKYDEMLNDINVNGNEPHQSTAVSNTAYQKEKQQFIGDVSQLQSATVIKFNIERAYGFFSIDEGKTLYFHIKQFRYPVFTGNSIILGEQEIPDGKVISSIAPGASVLYGVRHHAGKGDYASPWTLSELVQKIKQEEVEKELYHCDAHWKITATVSNNETKKFEEQLIDQGIDQLGTFTNMTDLKFSIKLYMKSHKNASVRFKFGRFDESTCEFVSCEKPF